MEKKKDSYSQPQYFGIKVLLLLLSYQTSDCNISCRYLLCLLPTYGSLLSVKISFIICISFKYQYTLSDCFQKFNVNYSSKIIDPLIDLSKNWIFTYLKFPQREQSIDRRNPPAISTKVTWKVKGFEYALYLRHCW